MYRSLVFLSALALFAGSSGSLLAQQMSADDQTSQPAPIVHAYQSAAGRVPGPGADSNGMRMPPRQPRQTIDSSPVAGVWLRADSGSKVSTISAEPKKAEFRLEHGRLNVTVHQPQEHAEILVDLPGGQTALLKDGLYTFNADTNTVRVLQGEAAAYPGTADSHAKPIKIKTDHQLAFTTSSTRLKSVDAYPYELSADLLPPSGVNGYGYRYGYEGYDDRGYVPYGYPYYAYGWGYPWAWGYPYGYGLGFGYYGGFGRGFGGFRR
jgi:hypothetical protein